MTRDPVRSGRTEVREGWEGTGPTEGGTSIESLVSRRDGRGLVRRMWGGWARPGDTPLVGPGDRVPHAESTERKNKAETGKRGEGKGRGGWRGETGAERGVCH